MKKLSLCLGLSLMLVGCAHRSLPKTATAIPVASKPDRSLAYVLREELKRNFQVPAHCRRAMCEADVSFRLGLKGEFLNPTIVKSSGDKRFNEAALRSLRKTRPVDSVPADLIGQTVKIHFDSNVAG